MNTVRNISERYCYNSSLASNLLSNDLHCDNHRTKNIQFLHFIYNQSIPIGCLKCIVLHITQFSLILASSKNRPAEVTAFLSITVRVLPLLCVLHNIMRVLPFFSTFELLFNRILFLYLSFSLFSRLRTRLALLFLSIPFPAIILDRSKNKNRLRYGTKLYFF